MQESCSTNHDIHTATSFLVFSSISLLYKFSFHATKHHYYTLMSLCVGFFGPSLKSFVALLLVFLLSSLSHFALLLLLLAPLELFSALASRLTLALALLASTSDTGSACSSSVHPLPLPLSLYTLAMGFLGVLCVLESVFLSFAAFWDFENNGGSSVTGGSGASVVVVVGGASVVTGGASVAVVVGGASVVVAGI